MDQEMGETGGEGQGDTQSAPSVVEPAISQHNEDVSSHVVLAEWPRRAWHFRVQPAPAYWTKRDATKFLDSIAIAPPLLTRVEKMHLKNHFYITLQNLSASERLEESINATLGDEQGDATLTANCPTVVRDAVARIERAELPSRARLENEDSNERWVVVIAEDPAARKRARVDDKFERLEQKRRVMNDGERGAGDVVAPWRKKSYSEQVVLKKASLTIALEKVMSSLWKECKFSHGNSTWPPSIVHARGKGVCCPLEIFIEAPEECQEYYRNKNEFSVGLDDSNRLAVGYSLGLISDGETRVAQADLECLTTSKRAIQVADCLRNAFESTMLPAWDKRKHTGVWRLVMVREGIRTGDCIVIIVIHPQNLEGQVIRSAQDVVSRSLKTLGFVTGAMWQSFTGVSNAVELDTSLEPLFGEQVFHECIAGMRFRVSPSAFLQVNTIMAEKLYHLITDWLAPDSDSIVLDICCGTGTIGMFISRTASAHRVYGIELVREAVEDAKRNAEVNQLTRCAFVAGKAENTINGILSQVGTRGCVSVVDPPRSGLHQTVVRAIRASPTISRIAYVACNPENFWMNAVGFCRPRSNAFRGEPFRLVKAAGVDLFPQTPHCEMVVLLER
uniref:Methyltransferase domain-containing protein n=1 Tax=Compsopogon caeruleus TaxID=31354 RepID=A0A7S1XGQ3_9RHOD